MPECPTLATARLTMRPFRSEDLEPLLAIMTTDEVRASLHVPEGYSRADAWSSLVSYAGLWTLRGLGQWALEERGTGRFLGRAGLHWRTEPEWPGVEVGWLVDPAVWGRGYATEAGSRAVAFGFDVLGERSLFSVILPENLRSQGVARRLGFSPWEARVLSFFPSQAHMVWRLDRADPDASGSTAG